MYTHTHTYVCIYIYTHTYMCMMYLGPARCETIPAGCRMLPTMHPRRVCVLTGCGQN